MADEDLIPEPGEGDLRRIDAILKAIGGKNVQWGAQQVLEVLLVERRLRAEREASARLIRATWVLAAATVILALATVGLIFATVAD